MTDLELTRRCAVAMGMRQFQWFPSGDYPDQHGTYEILGGQIMHLHGNPRGGYNRYSYDPLHDDAQAMALVKKFRPTITWGVMHGDGSWYVNDEHSDDLNRAICECVAKLGEAK